MGATVLVADIPAVPALSPSSGKPNSLARPVSALRDLGEQVGADSYTWIDDLAVLGVLRIPGPVLEIPPSDRKSTKRPLWSWSQYSPE